MRALVASALLVVCVQAQGGPGIPVPPGRAAASTLQAVPSKPARPPRRDDLVALEMGGYVESSSRSWSAEFAPVRLLDGDPATVWTSASSSFPQQVVLSFLGHDSALVAGLTVTLPRPGTDPGWGGPGSGSVWPKDIEIWTSTQSPTDGFRKVVASSLPMQPGDHAVAFPAPVEARYVKLVITSNHGSDRYTALAGVAVREGQAPGYVPFLTRHADLAALLSSGVPPESGGGQGAAPAADPADVCAPPAAAANRPAHTESRTVLVVAADPGTYAPYIYATLRPDSPPERYFPAGPGDGRVDSSIFRRATLWTVPPDAAYPAKLVPSSGVDTVVLSQLCDIKTSVSDSFKRALVGWVAAGHKLIIQDADKCGPTREPDYGFLPFPLATSNPGAKGAASSLSIIESNGLASPDPGHPAFLDEESWRLKTKGNSSNDFGDSNTVVRYDPNWCGAIVGTNINNTRGFVLAYAHYGLGVILYDGLDFDQFTNAAYRQYAARQLLLPFNPDDLPCSTRLAPFVVSTDALLVSRTVLPGETCTYPLTVFANRPDYKGTVRLSLSMSPAMSGVKYRFEPETVNLGIEAKASLTVTMPAKLPDAVRIGVRGTAADATATLCLAARERRTGTLTVVADLERQAPSPSRKNLLFVLDLSGSMNLALGRSTRIATARSVLRDVLPRIPDDFNVGLRLYGHRYGSKEKATCTDSELAIPIKPLNRDAILTTVDRLRPRGETPLVYSILQAASDLKSAGGGSVVLITDGEESCGGDFGAATNTLRQSGLDLRLSIVGFTLKGQQAKQQLGAIATATGGDYYTAADGPALTRALVAATISRFPYTVVSATGAVVARGEAGDKGQELPPGDYKVVVLAGDEELVARSVSVLAAGGVTVRIARKGNRYVLER